MSENIEDRVTKWVAERGYALEMDIARALQHAEFGIMQSEFIPDPGSEKWRETDVIGYCEEVGQTCRAIFMYVVECKGNPKYPWVMFAMRGESYPVSLSITRRATSQPGESILGSLVNDPEVQQNPLFELGDTAGYGVTLAFREGKGFDDAHDALNSVCKAAVGMVRRLHRDHVVPFAWPVVVIDAPLLTCGLDDRGNVVVNEIDKGLLVWRNPLIQRHSLVQIFRRTYFVREAASLRRAAAHLLKKACREDERSPRWKS